MDWTAVGVLSSVAIALVSLAYNATNLSKAAKATEVTELKKRAETADLERDALRHELAECIRQCAEDKRLLVAEQERLMRENVELYRRLAGGAP